MRTILCADSDNHPFCCGVYEVGSFYHSSDSIGIALENNFPVLEQGGTGLFTATFLDTPECRDAYKKLTERYTLLFQSEPRVNRNTQRRLFLCVFQGRE